MLAIDMWDWRGNYLRAEADWVRVEGVKRRYRLRLPRDYYAYSGRGASGLRVHAGTFSTYDQNNLYGSENCAVRSVRLRVPRASNIESASRGCGGCSAKCGTSFKLPRFAENTLTFDLFVLAGSTVAGGSRRASPTPT